MSAQLAPMQDTRTASDEAPSPRAFLDAYAAAPSVQMYQVAPIENLADLGHADGAVVLHGAIAGTGPDFVRTTQPLDSGTGTLAMSARYVTLHVDRTGDGGTVDVLVPVWSGPSARAGQEGPKATEAQLALVPVGANVVIVGRRLDGIPGYVPVHSTGAIFLKDRSGWLSISPVLEKQAHDLTDAELIERVSSTG